MAFHFYQTKAGLGSYSVIIAPKAWADIEIAYEQIRSSSPQNARNWLTELFESASSLRKFPYRCKTIRENIFFLIELRQLIHLPYRILFSIDEERKLVLIHTVRHTARKDVEPDDF